MIVWLYAISVHRGIEICWQNPWSGTTIPLSPWYWAVTSRGSRNATIHVLQKLIFKFMTTTMAKESCCKFLSRASSALTKATKKSNWWYALKICSLWGFGLEKNADWLFFAPFLAQVSLVTVKAAIERTLSSGTFFFFQNNISLNTMEEEETTRFTL